MKILAWIFIVLGIISCLFAFINTFNLWTSPPEDFEGWFLEKKMRNKLMINSIIDFIIAGWLFNQTKPRKINPSINSGQVDPLLPKFGVRTRKPQ